MLSKQWCRQEIPGFHFAAKLLQHNRHHEVFLSGLLMGIQPFPAQEATLSAVAAAAAAGTFMLHRSAAWLHLAGTSLTTTCCSDVAVHVAGGY